MKTSYILILAITCIWASTSEMHGQTVSPFYGEWNHVKGNDLIKKVNVLPYSKSGSESVILLRLKNEDRKRVSGSFSEQQDSLVCNFEFGVRLFQITLHPVKKGLLKAKIVMSAEGIDIRETNYSYYRKVNNDEEGIKPDFQIVGEIVKEPKEPKEENTIEVKEMQFVTQKGKIDIKLEACKNCNQYAVLIKNDLYQKSGIPNKNGEVKFSEVPFGKYKITVNWAGKMDRPDQPPFKSKSITLNGAKSKKVIIPKK